MLGKHGPAQEWTVQRCVRPCWPVHCPGLPASLSDFGWLPGYFPVLSDAQLSQGMESANDLLVLLLRVESMSMADRGNPGNITSRLVEKKKARDCLIPMG